MSETWFVNYSETDTGDDRGNSVGCVCIGPHEGDAADAFAFSVTFGTEGSDDETDRKFALMAAAPDLLAACQKLDELDWCCGYEMVQHEVLQDALDMARAAILKAKGTAST